MIRVGVLERVLTYPAGLPVLNTWSYYRGRKKRGEFRFEESVEGEQSGL